MNKILFISFVMFTVGLLFISCEQDDFTEKELLERTSQTDLNIFVEESRTSRSIGGAQISLVIGGEVITIQTDSSGIAYIKEVPIGQATLHITKEGYFDFHDQINIDPYGREASDSYTAGLYSKSNTARITGNIKIQTDLTTDSAEHPAGIKIHAIENDKTIASTQTDNNGDFDLHIPTDNNYGRYVWVKFPDLEYDQKIAIRLNDTTVVEKTAVGTVFKPYEEAQEIENTSNIRAEVEPPVYSGNYVKQAYIKSITVTSGSITNVELGFPGRGYPSWHGPYDIDVFSSTGSGANIEVNGTGTYRPYYYPLNPGSVQIYNGGINYPDHIPNENVYTQSPIGFIWDDDFYYSNARLNSSERIYAGEIYRINANYGTGTITGDIQ